MIKFQSEARYSPQVMRNDTKLLILRSNGDVMTASQSLRNVDESHWALQIVGMQYGKKEIHFHNSQAAPIIITCVLMKCKYYLDEFMTCNFTGLKQQYYD